MSNENALFDEDFEDVFSDDPLADLVRPAAEAESAAEEDAEPAVAGVVADNDAGMISPAEPSGGDAMLPAISIKLFYERQETRGLMEVCAHDRRMPQALPRSRNVVGTVVTPAKSATTLGDRHTDGGCRDGQDVRDSVLGPAVCHL